MAYTLKIRSGVGNVLHDFKVKNTRMHTTNERITLHEEQMNVLKMSEAERIRFCRLNSTLSESILIKENMLLSVIAGELRIAFGESTYFIKAQQIVFLRKGISVEYHFVDLATTVLWFELTSHLLLEFTTSTTIPKLENNAIAAVLVREPSHLLLTYMKSLQCYFQHQNYLSAKLVKIKLMEFLFCISENDQEVFQQFLQSREYFRPDIRTLVEENLMNTLSLPQLGRLAGRSVSSLRRDCYSTFNMPPSRLIRQRKLEKAKELLVNTNMTVTSICYSLGFESVAHFSRAFKSHFSFSPSGLRMKGPLAAVKSKATFEAISV